LSVAKPIIPATEKATLQREEYAKDAKAFESHRDHRVSFASFVVNCSLLCVLCVSVVKF